MNTILTSLQAPLRVGVLGVGVMGQHHARLYASMPDVDLVGVLDADPQRAAQIASRCGCQPFTELDALLDEGLDAVSVVVPTADHHAATLACLDRGIHCLVEKPLASTFQQCQELNAAAASRHLLLMVGHIERFNPAIQALRDIIGYGTLGPIIGISSLRVAPRPPRITDAGIMLDVGCHDIDLLSWLTDRRATEVRATVIGTDATMGADAATIHLEFGLFRSGVAEMSWLYRYKNRRLTVQWEHCTALLDFMKQQLIISNTIGASEVPIMRAEPLRRELTAFLQAIRTDGESPVPGADSLYTLQVIEAAQQSAAMADQPWLPLPALELEPTIPAEFPRIDEPLLAMV